MGRPPVIVLDTHALLWWLGATDKLSAPARRALRRASAERPAVASSISLFEICTAERRGRLVLAMPLSDWFAEVQALTELRFEPVTPGVAMRAGRLSDDVHGDPGDRLIAATALELALPLLTADEKLQRVPGLKTVW